MEQLLTESQTAKMLNLAHVLADLGPTYSSVNVRTAAYRIDGAWYSLITVVRFSELSEEEMGNKTAEAWQQHADD
ncbi:MAG TPA: hypothetical protein VGK01_18375 [Candidatus Angelobacter sp.]|jgi:hypothetical protein